MSPWAPVFGVGWPRTGTTTLKTALEQLGRGPCDHMTELVSRPDRIALWGRLDRGDRAAALELFGPGSGWRSGVDNPTCCFWRELAEAFPVARFVLTVRDAAGWYASYSEAIHANTFGPSGPTEGPLGDVVALLRRCWLDRALGGRVDDPAGAMGRFTEHNRAVLDALGDRVLVFRPEDGWAPLCGFLGVDVPEVPFPRKNTRAFIREHGLHER